MFGKALAQVTSGLIIGLIAVIYAISYAALMFAGPLAPFVAYGIAITLITAAIGALYGLFAEESTLVSGPDSNTTSVLAGIMMTAAATPLAAVNSLNHAMVVVLAASVVTALTYLLIERFNAARLVRFIPFQVMAGFLASTGWLMSSGALNIISGTPLSINGVLSLVERPARPELLVGVLLVIALFQLNKRFKPAVVVPVFVVVVSVVVNLVTRPHWIPGELMQPDRWFFRSFDRLEWLPPWQLQFSVPLLKEMLGLVPSFLVVGFVGTLTVLLSLSSLELLYKRDFKLEPALRLHGYFTLLAAALGGYVGLLSIGRSSMCRETGGGRWTGVVAAGVCLGVLFGLGFVIAWIPKVALGALVLYLGVGMVKQWLWDLRSVLGRAALLEIVAIVVCVAIFGYVVGFVAGVLLACIIFVLNYSKLPYIRADTTLVSMRSPVIRSVAQQQALAQSGGTCRIGRFDGYIFFGVAHSIYEWYAAVPPDRFGLLVLDFTQAKGIDQSAAAVLKKIVRTEAGRKKTLIVALAHADQAALADVAGTPGLKVTGAFDSALELAEELVLAASGAGGDSRDALEFVPGRADRTAFGEYLGCVELQTGDTLFAEGQGSNEMYFLERGRLEVVKHAVPGATLRLAKVLPGAMIGEMALYSGQPRTATVVAVEPASLLVLSKTAWSRLRQERPDLAVQLDHHVIASLTNSLSRTNAALSQQVAGTSTAPFK